MLLSVVSLTSILSFKSLLEKCLCGLSESPLFNLLVSNTLKLILKCTCLLIFFNVTKTFLNDKTLIWIKTQIYIYLGIQFITTVNVNKTVNFMVPNFLIQRQEYLGHLDRFFRLSLGPVNSRGPNWKCPEFFFVPEYVLEVACFGVLSWNCPDIVCRSCVSLQTCLCIKYIE